MIQFLRDVESNEVVLFHDAVVFYNKQNKFQEIVKKGQHSNQSQSWVSPTLWAQDVWKQNTLFIFINLIFC